MELPVPRGLCSSFAVHIDGGHTSENNNMFNSNDIF
jgi:hypothetical protein